MKSTVDVYFKVMRIIALALGILCCITIIGAILGIPLIIASNKFRDAADMSDEALVANRSSILGWGIFLSIVLAPTLFGFALLLIFTFMIDNYIKNIEEGNYAQNDKTFSETVSEGAQNTWNSVKNTVKGKSEIDKQREELLKLEKMREDGLISKEEYDALRRKILGL